MDFALKQIKTSLPFVGFIDSRQGGRPENQDSCGFVDTALGLLVVVCDGMGGGPGGRTASMMAVDTIVRVIRSATADSDRTKAIQAAVERAHAALQALQEEKPELQGMGTTVAILLISQQSAMIAHVGDSRIYQFRRGQKIFRTQDHSQVGEMVRKHILTEEEARISPNSNILQRAVGVGGPIKVDISEQPYEKGDRFVLCTDGVWGIMNEKSLIASMAKTKAPSGAVEKTMIKVDEIGTSEGNHHDNFTMALVVTSQNSKLVEPMTTKTRNLILGLTALCGISLIGNVILLTHRSEKASDESEQQSLLTDSILNLRLKEQEEKITEQLQAKNQHTVDSIFDALKKIKKEQELQQVVAKEATLREERAKIIKKLDTILEQLEQIRKMKAGEKKQTAIDKAVKEINKLSANNLTEYGVKKEDFTKVTELLGNSIAHSDVSNAKFKNTYDGHYKGKGGIITRMKEIKNKVINK
jgi:serine/threonine protein phosphatase PrpC